jgi:hypothetical protein
LAATLAKVEAATGHLTTPVFRLGTDAHISLRRAWHPKRRP